MNTRTIITDQKGTSVIEFAIIVPLLLVLVGGIIEFSILFYNKAMITNASREGARAGVIFAPTRPDQAYIQGIVDAYASNHLINFDTSQVVTTTAVHTDTDSNGAIDPGEPLIVTVSYTYQFLALPNILSLVKGSFTNTIDIVGISRMNYE
jgi:Flp pilus assembly protein TadG